MDSHEAHVPTERLARVKLLERENGGGLMIQASINGLNASVPIRMVERYPGANAFIGAGLGDQFLHGSKDAQQVAMTMREFFMDYDDVAELYQNRRFTGGTTKQYALNSLGVFTTSNDLKQIVWTFPEVDSTDLTNWNPLPDNRKWPVFVRPPKGSMYPGGFGRGMAFRCKRGPTGMVYLVKKEPLQPADQYEIEIPKYVGKIYQVPEFMCCFRRMGVIEIDRSTNSITFIRRGTSALITTVNELRTLNPNTQDHMDRMVALIDVINDYPEQLADLLNPGEVQMSKAYQTYLSEQEEEGGSDSSSSADSPSAPDPAAVQAYRPPPQQQQQPNPFAQYAQRQFSAPPAQPGAYPMTYNSRQ
jgi:hypothetical protein